MADYTIVATDVVWGTARTSQIVAGEALAAGDIICRLVSDGKGYKADANVATKAVPIGICVASANTGQPVCYVSSGEVTVGAVFLAAGKLLILSATAGKMADAADAVATWREVLMGWSTATNKVKINIVDTAITLA